jgi:hypothetical protein
MWDAGRYKKLMPAEGFPSLETCEAAVRECGGYAVRRADGLEVYEGDAAGALVDILVCPPYWFFTRD